MSQPTPRLHPLQDHDARLDFTGALLILLLIVVSAAQSAA